jgi:Dyp-type peroxidase family
MAVTLDTPVSWKTPSGDDAAMLDALQPNIVKGHVREHLRAVFLQFGGGSSSDDDYGYGRGKSEGGGGPAEARRFLAAVAGLMKSARTHLEEVEAHHASGNEAKGTPYIGIGLSHAGYQALGVDPAPADGSFRAGMKSQQALLADPPPDEWEAPYRGDVHAVILIGDEDADSVVSLRQQIEALRPASVSILGEETGRGQHNPAGDGIEHFGYVDGRSQPLFLTEDIDAENASEGAADHWDPAFALGRVIIADPAAPDPDVHFGSYFVFRKLEQNVQAFKRTEEHLADQLGLVGDDRERAGAMLVGRFEDGTPLTLEHEANGHQPVVNNFDYDADGAGAKCPFQGHIRKTNPRGSGGFGQSEEQERLHLMARRGQTYGEREDDPSAELPSEQRPTGGVGLLFMAFNVDLGEQFEFTQATWADNAGFPQVPSGHAPAGLDPVIGQGPRGGVVNPPVWGEDGFASTDPATQAVHMKGGEYFFMPSLPFLRAL